MPQFQVANSPLSVDVSQVENKAVVIDGQTWYRITHADKLRPFIMSVVSASDHWLFIASTGGVTAGRVSPDTALFPYDNEDRLAERYENTGGKTILRVTRGDVTHLWEPWSERYAGLYRVERNLYKHAFGDELVFEEINFDLQLTFRASWRVGDAYGFVRKVTVSNQGDACEVDVLDGLQNVMPHGPNVDLQKTLSVLIDAYKRHELDVESGLGLYRMTASLTSQAKPCAALRANVVWCAGMDPKTVLLCRAQVDEFRAGRNLDTEVDIRGRRGAYWVNDRFGLAAEGSRSWALCADVAKDHSQVIDMIDLLKQKNADERMVMLEADMQAGRMQLKQIVAAADGLQCTGDKTAVGHHFANSLFNVMRGGIFADGYQVQRDDLVNYIEAHNMPLAQSHRQWLAELPEILTMQQLREVAANNGNADITRLMRQYMPLMFARRHGDVTRPWNFFNIKLKNSDGSKRLDYQGNWRDIFQNWEALLLSHPEFLDNALAVFLNATSLDGYNPAAISRNQITWHKQHPDRPTQKVGHSGDHQIIYLLKLLEMQQKNQPGVLAEQLDIPAFSYSHIPYHIRPVDEILANPFDSIEFLYELDEQISERAARLGNDGRLLLLDGDQPRVASLLEKLLTLALAKLGNFVAGGGIWMNTQRPEWNDGNSALSGWGLSVVTLCYLHRFLVFLRDIVKQSKSKQFVLSQDVAELLQKMQAILSEHSGMLDGEITDEDRYTLLMKLGGAHGDFRTAFFKGGSRTESTPVGCDSLIDFLDQAIAHCRHSILLNRRDDDLYHGYNLLVRGDGAIGIKRLFVMLEAQVAVLSSGCLDDEQALRVLNAMPQTDLFCEKRNSYMLCPERQLNRFLDINILPDDAATRAPLLKTLVETGHCNLVTQDGRGQLHFAGGFYNDDDVKAQLDMLAADPKYAEQVKSDYQTVLDIFEEVFDHHSFTGRAGTMYGYEGLGCIYWHMVSKLLVAIDERANQAGDIATQQAFRKAYEHTRNGLSFTRTAAQYGAFPTDPYSHTRSEGGARQPGMTGQVKEELLTRVAEMGMQIRGGEMHFDSPLLLDEALTEAATFEYFDVNGEVQQLELQAGEQCFTFCQVPVVLSRGQADSVVVEQIDGSQSRFDGLIVAQQITRQIFARDGQIKVLRVVRA